MLSHGHHSLLLLLVPSQLPTDLLPEGSLLLPGVAGVVRPTPLTGKAAKLIGTAWGSVSDLRQWYDGKI